MTQHPRIVLLHATTVAIDPIQSAFRSLWPEPELVNLLDDALTPDRARDAELTEALIARFVSLGRYALSIGADAILVTCSAFGPAIEQMAREFPVPVLKPNEAMFEAALEIGPKVGMVATFAPSIITMEAEFAEYAASIGGDATLTTILVEDAMTALRAGDTEAHNARIAARIGELDGRDAIMLAHFSTSRAQEAAQAKTAVPVLSAPSAAVARLRTLIER
ncbi:aspartate/glutamate racemase family protein [Flavisphingomonas formosensis]|uniref:aspartate/glutamate racemase family protein n=1 Tax=Flavisphingomonas formosensis TaxID=861534 RepID=UPI0012FC94C7|nr:aspartate/glutamate racemase family protein [Sphingomonas formosensis]